MADYKLSDLTEATSLINTDLMHLRTIGNIDKKITFLNVLKSIREVKNVSANYTVLDTDKNPIIFVTTSSTDRTITLPTLSANLGKRITISKVDSGTGKVIIDGEGAEIINGDLTYDLIYQYDTITIVGQTAGWIITAITPLFQGAVFTWSSLPKESIDGAVMVVLEDMELFMYNAAYRFWLPTGRMARGKHVVHGASRVLGTDTFEEGQTADSHEQIVIPKTSILQLTANDSFGNIFNWGEVDGTLGSVNFQVNGDLFCITEAVGSTNPVNLILTALTVARDARIAGFWDGQTWNVNATGSYDIIMVGDFHMKGDPTSGNLFGLSAGDLDSRGYELRLESGTGTRRPVRFDLGGTFTNTTGLLRMLGAINITSPHPTSLQDVQISDKSSATYIQQQNDCTVKVLTIDANCTWDRNGYNLYYTTLINNGTLI